MPYRVLLHPKAEEELNALYDTIAEKADPTTAWSFVSGIRTFCLQLADFPERGTERVELMPGLRIIGYRRSVSIASRRLTVDISAPFVVINDYKGW
jgi:toxin ParE1/3/4